MRIQIPIVVEMTDEQVQDYADAYGLDTRAKTVTDDVRKNVLHSIQSMLAGSADITLKR